MTDNAQVRNLSTPRLLLRSWGDEDLEPFAALNADPRVMKYFPAPLNRDESDRLARRIQEEFRQNPFGLWAVQEKQGAPFVGFVGLKVARFEAPFTPCVEVGWRLAYAHWGKGYATEAARAALRYGFDDVGLEKVHSFCAAENTRSMAVMKRLGMRLEGTFEHSGLSEGHPLRPHVLYSIESATDLYARGLAINGNLKVLDN